MVTGKQRRPRADAAFLANCADPDQTPHNAASDQGLHCLQIQNVV